MSYFAQALVNGIALGGMYTILVLGFSVIRGVMGVINLAHGLLTQGVLLVAIVLFVPRGLVGLLDRRGTSLELAPPRARIIGRAAIRPPGADGISVTSGQSAPGDCATATRPGVAVGARSAG